MKFNTIFKYYRSNFFFEKAIRYNEIYFSETSELNDPHDLKVQFFFEDDPILWEKVISLQTQMNGMNLGNWDLSIYFDSKNKTLLNELNNLFKGKEVVDINSLNNLIDEKQDDIRGIFSKYQNINVEENKFPPDIALKMVPILLKDKLTKALNHNIYSASFSKNPLSPLMWAHYADGFKGCVVIYEISNDKMLNLRHHYQAPIDRSESYKFTAVKYKNIDKQIPILQSAIDKSNVLIDACLMKNSFWDYEEEYRLLTSIEIDTIKLAHTENSKPSFRDRIMYHDSNAILGVIFGPRCTQEYKRKIQLIIGDSRKFNGDKPFLLFSTKLCSTGILEIIEGNFINPKEDIELKRILKGNELNKYLIDLGILSRN